MYLLKDKKKKKKMFLLMGFPWGTENMHMVNCHNHSIRVIELHTVKNILIKNKSKTMEY